MADLQAERAEGGTKKMSLNFCRVVAIVEKDKLSMLTAEYCHKADNE